VLHISFFRPLYRWLYCPSSGRHGQGGKIEGAYFKADDSQTNKMNEYAEQREAQNKDPNREAYDLTGNNCGTFMDQTIQAGGVGLPTDLSARPNGQVDTLQNAAAYKVEFDPNKKTDQTTVTPNTTVAPNSTKKP
jgi:hypothetical protein